MGRVFYQPPARQEDKRCVHLIVTEHGTVALAMRPPFIGERGFAVGLDNTLRDAVREMFSDWNPGEKGPGWECCETSRSVQMPGPDDDTFLVTILAAFEPSEVSRG